MRTFHPGKIEGYALLGALAALVVVSIAGSATILGLSSALRLAGRLADAAAALVEARSAAAESYSAAGADGAAEDGAVSEENRLLEPGDGGAEAPAPSIMDCRRTGGDRED